MRKGGAGYLTPWKSRRDQENKVRISKPTVTCSSPTRLNPLSPLNLNAAARSPLKNNNIQNLKGNSPVIWSNATFQTDLAQTNSCTESNGSNVHNPDASTHNQDYRDAHQESESGSASSTESKEVSGSCKDNEELNADIEEIEKQISLLTQKLTELKVQQASQKKDQEFQISNTKVSEDGDQKIQVQQVSKKKDQELQISNTKVSEDGDQKIQVQQASKKKDQEFQISKSKVSEDGDQKIQEKQVGKIDQPTEDGDHVLENFCQHDNQLKTRASDVVEENPIVEHIYGDQKEKANLISENCIQQIQNNLNAPIFKEEHPNMDVEARTCVSPSTSTKNFETPMKIEGCVIRKSCEEEPKAPKSECRRSSEKKKSRTVSSRFLLWDNNKSEKKTTPETNGKKILRRAASMGPTEYLKMKEFSNLKEDNGAKTVGKQKSREEGNQERVPFSERNTPRPKGRSLSMSPMHQRPSVKKAYNPKSSKKGGTSMQDFGKKAVLSPLQESTKTRASGVEAQLQGSLKNVSAIMECKQRLNLSSDELDNNADKNASTNNNLKSGQKSERLPSPSSRRSRVIPSRYGQSLQREKGSQNSNSSLSSIKNAHGKRVLPDNEKESVQGRGGDNKDCKRRIALPDSPRSMSSFLRRTQSEKSATPSAKTPSSSSKPRMDLSKFLGSVQKDCKIVRTVKKAAQEAKNQSKSSMNRFSMLLSIDSRKSSAGIKDIAGRIKTLDIDSPDGKVNLPRIRTTRYTANSPRDSGCIKRAKDCEEKKSFFAPDENDDNTHTIWRESCHRSQKKEIVDEIRQSLCFDEDEPKK